MTVSIAVTMTAAGSSLIRWIRTRSISGRHESDPARPDQRLAVHVPKIFVRMRMGGESNRSLERILRKSREDYRALRSNRVGGLFTLLSKNASKIGQFF